MSKTPLTVKQFIKLCQTAQAITVPSGIWQVLPIGSEVQIMQLRQDAATVLWQGGLYWLQADQLAALGVNAPPRPFLANNQNDEALTDFIWQQLTTCFDPEIPVNIVELGLVYQVKIQHLLNNETLVLIKMTLTAPGCGMGEVIAEEARYKILGAEQVDRVVIELVWNPPWSRERLSEAARLALGLF